MYDLDGGRPDLGGPFARYFRVTEKHARRGDSL